MNSKVVLSVLITSLSLTFLLASCGKKDVKSDPAPSMATQVAPPVQTALFDEQNDLEVIHFGYNSATLNSAATKALHKNVAWLKEKAHAKATIKAEGHCDERGSEDFNLKLGEKRAQAVKHYLVSHGIRAKRVTVESFGKDHPIDLGHDEAAWAQNRRCAFRVISQ